MVMDHENISLSAQTVDIAEHDLYLELTNRLCYYDDSNLNNVMLPYKDYEESALSCAETLVDMPVQAKYKKIKNKDDLGSHEMTIDSEGNVHFGTQSIGVHTKVWIKEDTVTTVSGETKTLPCLFAKCKVWKRYPKMISAIKRLYESDGGLNSSWEIATNKYEFNKGIKKLTDYSFMSNCFLGSRITAAYNGTSKTIEMSSLDNDELMIAEALSQDLVDSGVDIEIQEKEENNLQNNTNVYESDNQIVSTSVSNNKDSMTNTNTAEVNNTSEQSENINSKNVNNESQNNQDTTTVAALTDYDLRVKINKACRDKVDYWCWVSFLFPEEHEVWCSYSGETELDYLKFSYSVENDNVSVSDPEKVKLTVSPIAIEATISEYDKTIADKDDLIVKSSAEIKSLKEQVTELTQYKEKFEKAEQEKVEAELAQKKEDLINSVVKSGQITKEEIESSEELQGYVNSLDKKSLMSIVGERLTASIEENSKDNTSSKTPEVNVSTNINDSDDVQIDKVSLMRQFINKI